MGLLELDNHTLTCILCKLDTPQDLLRLSRACQRLHAAVHRCEECWQQLYQATYPKVPPTKLNCNYRTLFQDRWVKDAKELRLQRKVQRMRLQSDAAQLKRELAAAQESLRLERRYQQSLEQELRQVQRARLANSQSGQWQLGAVQLYHNRVVQAAPVRTEAKLMDLQQQQKLSQLQMQTLKSRIDMQRQRLHEVTRKLAAHKG